MEYGSQDNVCSIKTKGDIMVYEDAAIAAKYLIKTNYICRVMAFHPETQTVDLVQDVLEFCNTPDGEFTINNEFGIDVSAGLVKPDVLLDIPVLQLRWGQFEIQCCPKEGDTGVLAVFVNDIHDWAENDGPSIPNTDNHFMKTSSVFIPFIPSKKSCAQDYPTDNNSLVIKSASAKIVLTDDGTNTNVTVEAKSMNFKAENGFSFEGDVAVTGKVTATKNIESDGDVKAGTVSLKQHTHSGSSLTTTATVGSSATPGTISGNTGQAQ